MSGVAVGRNLLSNLLYFTVLLGVLMWYTRFLVDNLGPALYGVIPLSTTIINYLNLTTVALNASVGRYLTVDLAREDRESASVTFNTAFWGAAVLSLGLLPVVLAIAWFGPEVFNVPAGAEGEARALLLATGVSFLLTVNANAFNSVLFARNRLDLRNAASVLQLAIRVGLGATLVGLAGWSLWGITVGVVAASFSWLLLTVYFQRRLLPELKIRRGRFSVDKLKALMGMGGWMLLDQVGALFFLSTEVIVVNLLWGSAAAGRYGALILFPSTIRMISGFLAGVLMPVVIHRFSRGHTDWVTETSVRAVRLLGLALSLPAGLVAGLSLPLLVLWLGPDFADLRLLLVVMVVHLPVSLSIHAFSPVQVAAKKVMVPAVVNAVSGLIAVGLGVVLGWPALGIGMIGVALGNAAILLLKNGAFYPTYTAHVLEAPARRFLTAIVPGITGTVFLTVSGYLITLTGWLTSWAALFVAAVAVTVLFAPAAVYGLLSRDDRRWVIGVIGRARGRTST